MEFFNNVIFHEVSVGDVFVCVLAVMAAWFAKYSSLSDIEEEKTGAVLSFKKYAELNISNGISKLLSGLVVLTFVNEIGGYLLQEFVPGLPDGLASTLDYTLSALSGWVGYKIVQKFA